jgi:hypothetical protein
MNHNPVLALTSDGTPHAWLTWQECVVLKHKGNIAWELSDADIIMGGTSRMTGERSHIDIAPIIAIKGKFKFSMRAPVLTNQLLAHREKFCCGYCARKITRSADVTRDHIIPVSKNGQDIWTNVILACRNCNCRKDDKTPEQAGMQLLVVPYVPNRHEAMLIQNRHILYDQMEYIADYVNEKSRILEHIRESKQFD